MKEISRKCISINQSTLNRLNKLKKLKEESLGFKLSWDAFFNYILKEYDIF